MVNTPAYYGTELSMVEKKFMPGKDTSFFSKQKKQNAPAYFSDKYCQMIYYSQ
jgi:hypothetical protein